MRSLKDSLKEKIALLRIRQGDTEAFGFIYDSYFEKIFRYILFRVSDQGIAHDIVQDVFLQTWEYISAKKPVDNLQSFLYRVAYHKVIDYYRLKERQTQLIGEMDESHAVSTVDTKSEIEMHFLMKQIRGLKAEYQDVIILKHVEGLSAKEIAGILGKEVNAIRVTLHRALEALRKDTQSHSSESQQVQK